MTFLVSPIFVMLGILALLHLPAETLVVGKILNGAQKHLLNSLHSRVAIDQVIGELVVSIHMAFAVPLLTNRN